MTVPLDEAQWQRHLQTWRKEKDQFFRTHPESPLLPSVRGAFHGLSYYPPDPRFVLEVPMQRQSGAVAHFTTSRGGQTVEYQLYAKGTARFPDGSTQTIHVYAREHEHHGHAPHEPHELFLPFRDGTGGQTTYPAGRYLEVANPFLGSRAPEAAGTVDFNFAYNPFCAYSEEYVCPLPPRENWWKGRIEAGEKYDAALGPPSAES